MADSRVAETFWTGDTGRALRQHPAEVRELAIYLMTAPGKNVYGLYYKTVTSMAEETGRPMDVVTRSLGVLDELTFACFDDINSYVWVVEMAAYQLKPLPLHAGDFKIQNVNRWYQSCPRNIFLGAFFDRYADDLQLAGPRRVWVPTPAPASGRDTTLAASGAGKPLVQIPDPDQIAVPADVQLELSDTHRFDMAQGFEEFWQEYPNPVGKKLAKQRYYGIKPDRALHARIMDALRHQKQTNRKWVKDGGDFIPNPATWLNQGRWEDKPVNLPNLTAENIATLDARQSWLARHRAQKEQPDAVRKALP